MPPVSSKLRQLQRDRGADDGFLPVDRRSTAAAPIPSNNRGCARRNRGRWSSRSPVNGSSGPNTRCSGRVEHERGFALDIGQRRVGGQPHRRRRLANSGCGCCRATLRVQRLAIALGRPHPDGDARQSGNRLDDAHQLRRAKHAAEIAETRREIGDPHLSAVVVGQHGGDDGGVAHIFERNSTCGPARRRRSLSPRRPPAAGRRPDRRRSAESTTTRCARTDRPERRCGRCR